ncbi:MAG TPA: hypothetical protein VGH19_03405 [Verrucomicrobiae bacterium]
MNTPKDPKSYDFGDNQHYASLATHLHDTKQPDALQQLHDYTTASNAARYYLELANTLAVLQRLREGRTEQAYKLLEGRLDSHLLSFVSNYRQLPASVRANQPGMTMLQHTKDYRAKFPYKEDHPIIDEAVANAFKFLDEQK